MILILWLDVQLSLEGDAAALCGVTSKHLIGYGSTWRVLFVCFLFFSVSDTEIQPFYLLNYFKCAGVKNSVFVYFGLSHGCFSSSVGRENKSSCFFTWIVSTILNGLVELYQMEIKELFFLLLQKRLWASWWLRWALVSGV